MGADRAAEMYEMYACGATLQQVGAKHNISRERVRQVFKRYGYSIRTVRDVAERTRALEVRRADDILSMHTELKDVREVARRLGVSQVTVRDVVRAAERANPQPASRSRRKFGSTRKRYSDEELLECLKIASQELGGVLTTEAYVDFVKERTFGDGRPWPSSQVYRLRFGSWVDALHKAGLRANARSPIAGRPLFTVAHCTDAVAYMARQLRSRADCRRVRSRRARVWRCAAESRDDSPALRGMARCASCRRAVSARPTPNWHSLIDRSEGWQALAAGARDALTSCAHRWAC